MKKIFWITALLLVFACMAVLVGCDLLGSTSLTGTTNTTDREAEANPTASPDSQASSSENASSSLISVTEVDPASDESEVFEIEEATGDFSISVKDGGEYVEENGVYTLTAAGTYTLSGSLEGQIVVDAADAEVEIALAGVSITCGLDSPIKVVSADKVEISAKKETVNVIKDTRAEKTVDSDSQGEGAISAKCDLKLKGAGVLVIEAGYNNGVHTTKDLTIKNLSLKVTAVNNAIKGKDSVTLESGTILAISTKGDGIETANSDLSSKGKQRGTITLTDATVTVYAAGDGVQAAYNFVMTGGSLTVYTGSYSSYTASDASTTSYKGIKVENELLISGGTVAIRSYDDGLHADYNETLENGEVGLGNITISGGSVTIGVYSPTKATMGGFQMRGGRGWSAQQSVSGGDAIHADNTLTISGGTVSVDSAYEGLEATHIVIEGGETTVYATDDGVNANTKVANDASILITGGYLRVTVPTNGDTDGIDSNGTYRQTGGVVIVSGPGSASGTRGGGAFALDADGAITLAGGTLVLFGGMEKTPSASGMTRTVCSSSTVSAGEHSVTVGGEEYAVTLSSQTGGCVVYSDAGSATLK